LTQTKITINWSIDPTGSPCYEYYIEVFKQSEGGGWSLIHHHTTSRPKKQSYYYTAIF